MKDLEIIAEVHPQHSGDKGLIREMIRQAKLNGADVVKFQLYDAVAYLGSDQWKYLEFTADEVRQLKDWCDQENVEFMASVFDHERLGWCESVGVRRHKIASRVVTMYPDLCESILAIGKETIVSLGNWSGAGKPFGDRANIRHLYCKALYPAFLESMTDFPDDFPGQGITGYSDHTLGIDVALLAVSRGAEIVEKHFTLDKTRGRSTEKAHICSMTPDELNMLRRVGGSLHRTRRALEAAKGQQNA